MTFVTIPRQFIAAGYLACVLVVCLFWPEGDMRDGMLLAFGISGFFLAGLAWCSLFDFKVAVTMMDGLKPYVNDLIQNLQVAVTERDAWREECERHRAFLKSTTGVTLK